MAACHQYDFMSSSTFRVCTPEIHIELRWTCGYPKYQCKAKTLSNIFSLSYCNSPQYRSGSSCNASGNGDVHELRPRMMMGVGKLCQWEVYEWRLYVRCSDETARSETTSLWTIHPFFWYPRKKIIAPLC